MLRCFFNHSCVSIMDYKKRQYILDVNKKTDTKCHCRKHRWLKFWQVHFFCSCWTRCLLSITKFPSFPLQRAFSEEQKASMWVDVHICKCIHSGSCFNFDRVLHNIIVNNASYLFSVNNPPSFGPYTRFFSSSLLLPYKRLWLAPYCNPLCCPPRPTSPTSKLSSTAGKPAVSRNPTAAGRRISRLIYRIPVSTAKAELGVCIRRLCKAFIPSSHTRDLSLPSC